MRRDVVSLIYRGVVDVEISEGGVGYPRGGG
jgi:hypothetical protein